MRILEAVGQRFIKTKITQKNEKQEKQPQQNNEGQDTKETFKEMIALLMWVDSLPYRHLFYHHMNIS